MKLYHGSVVAVESPRIIKNEIGRDFGFAFYTTEIKEQAVKWAKRKALLETRRQHKEVLPVVSCYRWERDKANGALRVAEFQEADLNWLELVVTCRSRLDYVHGYDIVIGKVANDNVGETVSYVVRGIMRKEDAVKRLRFEKINNQIAFCTAKSLEYLKYDSYFECR